MTLNTGEKQDLCCEGSDCRPCPSVLLQDANSGNTYEEGSIDNAEHNGKTFGTEAEAQSVCDADQTCKGIWQRNNGLWLALYPGDRSWARGKPNGTVVSVKVKKVPVYDYIDGNIDNAEHNGKTFQTEAEVQAVCSADDSCKGIWQRNNGLWLALYPGSRSWARGVPNGTVVAVKLKTVPADEAAATGDPHMTLNTGEKQDLCCEGSDCRPCPSVLLQDANSGIEYVEGSIDNAGHNGKTFGTEAEAQTLCNADQTCKGIWQRNNGLWLALYPGDR